MKMEHTGCFETSAHKIQTSGNHPKESGKVNILNLRQKSILCAQGALNYGAKIRSEFIKSLTFLQNSQFSFWMVAVMTRPMHQDVYRSVYFYVQYTLSFGDKSPYSKERKVCFMNLIQQINSFSFYVLHQVGEL